MLSSSGLYTTISTLESQYIPKERFFDPPPGPPPINFVHESYMLDMMDIIDHVAAALGPLACLSRSARPRKCLN